MSLQNNDDKLHTDVNYNDLDECVASSDDRAPLIKDEKTIKDDEQDYKFTKKRRIKHKNNDCVTYNEIQLKEDAEYPIVKSHSRSRKSNSLLNVNKNHHKHHHSKKKIKTWKKVVISIVSALLAIIVIAVSSVVLLIYNGSNQMINNDYTILAPDNISTQNNGKYVTYNGKQYSFNENITNILCIGVDKKDIKKSNDNGTGGQADVLELVSIDTSNGNTFITNISRDTMTDVTTFSAGGDYVSTETMQICLSYAYGNSKESSCENTVNSVKRLFYNLPINTYFALDLSGISYLNDSIGGVDVVSPESIGEFKKDSSYHLMGKQAENFVRLRDTSVVDSNNSRMQRQQIYLNSFFNSAIAQTKKDFFTPISLFNSSAKYSSTNLNPSKICYLAENIISNGGISPQMNSVPGNIKMGKKYAEFYINEKDFYEMFLKIFYNPV